MVTVYFVEDQKKDQELLIDYLDRFEKENAVRFDVRPFTNASLFLSQYKFDGDIIFMDIDMPGLNGFDASVELRKNDSRSVLIFLTNLQQYAIKGYSVNAFDFIAKPLSYCQFSTLMKRALKKASLDRESDVIINTRNQIFKLDIKLLTYIEIIDHQLIYHTDERDYACWETMSSIKDQFLEKGFCSASVSVLVNLRRVDSITSSVVTLNDAKKTKIFLSRSQKKEFAKAFTSYITGV